MFSSNHTSKGTLRHVSGMIACSTVPYIFVGKKVVGLFFFFLFCFNLQNRKMRKLIGRLIYFLSIG